MRIGGEAASGGVGGDGGAYHDGEAKDQGLVLACHCELWGKDGGYDGE